LLSGPPPLLPGQAVRPKGFLNGKTTEAAESAPASAEAPATAQPASAEASTAKTSAEAKPSTRAKGKKAGKAVGKAAEAVVEPELAGLPMDAEGVIEYLTGRYKGVGVKTAEAVISAFGADGVFRALYTEPERVREVLGQRR